MDQHSGTWQHIPQENLHRFYNEPGPEVTSEWHHTMEDMAWWDLGNQPVVPSRAEEEPPRDPPEQQPQQLWNSQEQQPQQPQQTEPEE